MLIDLGGSAKDAGSGLGGDDDGRLAEREIDKVGGGSGIGERVGHGHVVRKVTVAPGLRRILSDGGKALRRGYKSIRLLAGESLFLRRGVAFVVVFVLLLLNEHLPCRAVNAVSGHASHRGARDGAVEAIRPDERGDRKEVFFVQVRVGLAGRVATGSALALVAEHTKGIVIDPGDIRDGGQRIGARAIAAGQDP